ncbi:MAG: hypothetical protein NWR72_10930 [Bacteroidia bacterium]|nr:hypothetical protein [Bacteroidia bacterium]
MKKLICFTFTTLFLTLFCSNLSAQRSSAAGERIDLKPAQSQTVIGMVPKTQSEKISEDLVLYSLYPNPADQFTVIAGTYRGEPCDDCLAVTIYYAETGEMFYESSIALTETIEHIVDLRDIPEGLFVVFFATTDGSYLQRDLLLIRR